MYWGSLNTHNREQILISVENNRKQIGKRYGDFEITVVDYDWDLLQQVNVVKCVRCGEEKIINNLSAFARGKGEGQLCKCRYKKEKPVKTEYSDYVGQTVNGFRLLSYEIRKGFRTECVECGKQKWAGGKAVLGGDVKCNHQIAAVYDESIIGNKYGHLTAVEKVGKVFRFRCDCGFEKLIRPTDVARSLITTCGRPECHYHRENGIDPNKVKAREDGFAFEKQLATVFEGAGYKVIRTPNTGDFGVDLIVEILGERWAFQCKKKKAPAGVRAVTEVYGGGRYYDCTRFCVASPSGFTSQAKQIAAKLGVQLETNTFHFGVTQEQNAENLLGSRSMEEKEGEKNVSPNLRHG